MSDGLQTRCKKCRRKYRYKYNKEYQTKWRKDNPEKIAEYKLRRRYGIDLEEYETLYREAGGTCQICKEKVENLCVDHCHTTGKVRGLLCFHCNTGLGHFRDSQTSLEEAIKYLKGQKECS